MYRIIDSDWILVSMSEGYSFKSFIDAIQDGVDKPLTPCAQNALRPFWQKINHVQKNHGMSYRLKCIYGKHIIAHLNTYQLGNKPPSAREIYDDYLASKRFRENVYKPEQVGLGTKSTQQIPKVFSHEVVIDSATSQNVMKDKSILYAAGFCIEGAFTK
ncbi:hypothetical protein ACHQEN_21255 [Vibrio vulnificus]|uniref:hypothetical protein n=1 Tax=Vibrio vulnificus TaxID=672 RepID=UPI002FBE66A4